MTSATEELRKLLDERGVEWVDTGDGSTLIPAQTATNVAWDVNTWPSGKDMGDCLWVQNRHPLTPEQAIAATLGSEREKALEELVRDMWFWGYEGHMGSESQDWQMKHIDGVLDRMKELGIEVIYE